MNRNDTPLTVNSVFPLAPLALELPHYVRRVPFMYLSMVSWVWYTAHRIIANMTDRSFDHAWRNFVKAVFLMLSTLMGSSSMWIAYMNQGPFEVRIRVAVNALCCTHLAIAWSEPWDFGIAMYVYVYYLIIAGLFGIAAVLYGLAWVKRHQWVSSVTLGGTAIEPMVLTVAVTGPRYRTVGDDARGGAIRLV